MDVSLNASPPPAAEDGPVASEASSAEFPEPPCQQLIESRRRRIVVSAGVLRPENGRVNDCAARFPSPRKVTCSSRNERPARLSKHLADAQQRGVHVPADRLRQGVGVALEQRR